MSVEASASEAGAVGGVFPVHPKVVLGNLGQLPFAVLVVNRESEDGLQQLEVSPSASDIEYKTGEVGEVPEESIAEPGSN